MPEWVRPLARYQWINHSASELASSKPFFSTDITLEPADVIALYVRQWQIEVTYAEMRAHLGVATQHQWNNNAIARTTPVLLGLYSLISLWACDLLTATSIPYAAAWYR